MLPDTIPPEKQALIGEVTHALRAIDGVAAIVLGGSYARGTQHAASDLDIGIYYSDARPFSIAAIRQVAASISSGPEPTVTERFGWGPWVNGGAWIQTRTGKLDFLYRSIEQVERTIQEAQRGIVQHDYYQQPTFGFWSVIYLGETQVCLPLYDPDGLIARLKKQVSVYPAALRQAIVSNFLWLAEFTLLHARDYAATGDVYNTAGCITRVASFLTQVLFALNETYFISDKKVMHAIAGLPLHPRDYSLRLIALLAAPGPSAAELENSVRALTALWREVVELTGGDYRPMFQVP
jgi:hypothetical protein